MANPTFEDFHVVTEQWIEDTDIMAKRGQVFFVLGVCRDDRCDSLVVGNGKISELAPVEDFMVDSTYDLEDSDWFPYDAEYAEQYGLTQSYGDVPAITLDLYQRLQNLDYRFLVVVSNVNDEQCLLIDGLVSQQDCYGMRNWIAEQVMDCTLAALTGEFQPG